MPLSENESKKKCFLVLVGILSLTSCESPLVENSREAERNGDVISSELMREFYPDTFVDGEPQYLERDFEAGADLICDEMQRKFERDVCADPDINWR